MMVSGITRMYGEQGQVSYRRSKGYVGSLGVVGTHTHIYIHMLGTLTFTLTDIYLHLLGTLTFTLTHAPAFTHTLLCVVCLCAREKTLGLFVRPSTG